MLVSFFLGHFDYKQAIKKVMSYTCKYCKQVLSTKKSLNQHFKDDHPEERPYTCGRGCGFASKYESARNRHQNDKCDYVIPSYPEAHFETNLEKPLPTSVKKHPELLQHPNNTNDSPSGVTSERKCKTSVTKARDSYKCVVNGSVAEPVSTVGTLANCRSVPILRQTKLFEQWLKIYSQIRQSHDPVMNPRKISKLAKLALEFELAKVESMDALVNALDDRLGVGMMEGRASTRLKSECECFHWFAIFMVSTGAGNDWDVVERIKRTKLKMGNRARHKMLNRHSIYALDPYEQLRVQTVLISKLREYQQNVIDPFICKLLWQRKQIEHAAHTLPASLLEYENFMFRTKTTGVVDWELFTQNYKDPSTKSTRRMVFNRYVPQGKTSEVYLRNPSAGLFSGMSVSSSTDNSGSLVASEFLPHSQVVVDGCSMTPADIITKAKVKEFSTLQFRPWLELATRLTNIALRVQCTTHLVHHGVHKQPGSEGGKEFVCKLVEDPRTGEYHRLVYNDKVAHSHHKPVKIPLGTSLSSYYSFYMHECRPVEILHLMERQQIRSASKGGAKYVIMTECGNKVKDSEESVMDVPFYVQNPYNMRDDINMSFSPYVFPGKSAKSNWTSASQDLKSFMDGALGVNTDTLFPFGRCVHGTRHVSIACYSLICDFDLDKMRRFAVLCRNSLATVNEFYNVWREWAEAKRSIQDFRQLYDLDLDHAAEYISESHLNDTVRKRLPPSYSQICGIEQKDDIPVVHSAGFVNLHTADIPDIPFSICNARPEDEARDHHTSGITGTPHVSVNGYRFEKLWTAPMPLMRVAIANDVFIRMMKDSPATYEAKKCSEWSRKSAIVSRTISKNNLDTLHTTARDSKPKKYHKRTKPLVYNHGRGSVDQNKGWKTNRKRSRDAENDPSDLQLKHAKKTPYMSYDTLITKLGK